MRDENEVMKDPLCKRTWTIIRSELEGMVLDVGCGDGLVTYKHPHVVGIDMRPQACRIPLVVGDMHHLPFRSSIFDVIVFSHSLEHTSHPNLALAEAYRAIKDGGKLIVSTPNAMHFLWPLYLAQHKYIYNKEHKSFFTFVSLKTLLGKNGFRVIRMFNSSLISTRAPALPIRVSLQRLFKIAFIQKMANKIASLHPTFSYELIVGAYAEKCYRKGGIILSTVRESRNALRLTANLCTMDILPRWRKAQRAELKYWEKECQRVANWEHDEFDRVRALTILREFEKIAKAKEDWRILDIGCGPTIYSRVFKKSKKYGLDPLIHEYSRAVNLPKEIRYVRGIGESVPFKDDSFNMAICVNVLDHAEKPEEVLKEGRRILKDEGYFILDVYTYTPIFKKVYLLMEKLKLPLQEEHLHYFKPDELIILSRRHFSLLKISILSEQREMFFTGQTLESALKNVCLRLILFFSRKLSNCPWIKREYLTIYKKAQ